jgi:hypothetical protein
MAGQSTNTDENFLQRTKPDARTIPWEVGMFPRMSANVASFPGEATTQTASEECLDIAGLNSLALRGLLWLFDEEKQLFCRRLVQTDEGFRREGFSPRRTIVALLGLQKLGNAEVKHPFDTGAMANAILDDRHWIRGIGDLGLLIWLTAVSAPERLDSLFRCFNLERALETHLDARQGRTKELAWFLSGLAHAKFVHPEASRDLADVAVETYHKLQENQGEDGVFGHQRPTHSPGSFFGSGFGTFADQIFSVYAFSKFAQAFQVEEPLEAATDCANAICAMQGEMGQWWFLYDKRRGRVANRYPILSMHQDGMAPTGLFALEEATGQSFDKAIYKGLTWICGANELGDDLRNSGETFIWDSIALKVQRGKYWEATLGFLGILRKVQKHDLSVCYEVRPDHFGWLLYAFGGFGLDEGAATS